MESIIEKRSKCETVTPEMVKDNPKKYASLLPQTKSLIEKWEPFLNAKPVSGSAAMAILIEAQEKEIIID
jgi:hypothetical protein